MPTQFTALNDKTFAPIQDEDRKAASRCFALLASCAVAAAALKRHAGKPSLPLFSDAMGDLACDLAQFGLSLDQDMRTLAGMLGCTLVIAEATEKGAQN